NDVNSIVCTSLGRGGPIVYIHGQGCGTNGAQYSALPSFFEAEVTAAQGCPAVDCGMTTTDACGNTCTGTRCDVNQVCVNGVCDCQNFPRNGCPPDTYWDDLACLCSQ